MICFYFGVCFVVLPFLLFFLSLSSLLCHSWHLVFYTKITLKGPLLWKPILSVLQSQHIPHTTCCPPSSAVSVLSIIFTYKNYSEIILFENVEFQRFRRCKFPHKLQQKNSRGAVIVLSSCPRVMITRLEFLRMNCVMFS